MLSVLHQKTIFFFLFFSFFLSLFFFFNFFLFFLSPLILPIIEELVWCFTRYWLLESLWSSYKGGKKISCRSTHPICSTWFYANFLYLKKGKKVGEQVLLASPYVALPYPITNVCMHILYGIYLYYFYIYYSSLIIFKTFYYRLLITPLFHS